MHHFTYRNGVLHAESVDLVRLAEAVGTPFYCYATATLERHYKVFRGGVRGSARARLLCLKANSNQAVIKTLARSGAGVDIVSGGELKRALAAGVPADKIVFSGVGKTKDDMAAASRPAFCRSMSRSEPELEASVGGRRQQGPHRPVSVRVNPDVDALTHAKISTGQFDNKFGIPISWARDVYARAARLPGVKVVGVDMHIGSQIIASAAVRQCLALLVRFGADPAVRRSCAATTSISAAASVFLIGPTMTHHRTRPPMPRSSSRATPAASACKLLFEPGRLMSGNAGILLTRVIYVKKGEGKTFVIVDAAMNDLVRPTLYEAHHDILPVD